MTDLSYLLERDVRHLDGNLEHLRPLTMERFADLWLRNAQSIPSQTPRDPDSEWASIVVMDMADDVDFIFDFIATVLARKPNADAISLLAAGTMEDLLADHGPKVIDRVEVWARKDPAVRHLLGGVWQNSMTSEIWERVQKAAGERW